MHGLLVAELLDLVFEGVQCVVVEDGFFGGLKGVEALLTGGGLGLGGLQGAFRARRWVMVAASAAALSWSAVRLRSARRSATVGAPWRA